MYIPEIYIAKWPDGRTYVAASDGQSQWSWHLASGIAGIIDGTIQKVS